MVGFQCRLQLILIHICMIGCNGAKCSITEGSVCSLSHKAVYSCTGRLSKKHDLGPRGALGESCVNFQYEIHGNTVKLSTSTRINYETEVILRNTLVYFWAIRLKKVSINSEMHSKTISAVFDNKFRNIGVPPEFLDKISSNNEVQFEFFSEHNSFTLKIFEKYIFKSNSRDWIFGRKFFELKRVSFIKEGNKFDVAIGDMRQQTCIRKWIKRAQCKIFNLWNLAGN